MEHARYLGKIPFTIEELAKSSRPSELKEAIVYKIDEFSWNSIVMANQPLDLSRVNTSPVQIKRKAGYDSYSDCSTSPANTSEDSDSDRFKKKARANFTNSQILVLEQYYASRKYLPIEDRPILAKRLKMNQAQIKWWFQNRRMKEKRQIKRGNCTGNLDSDLSCFVTPGKPGPRNIMPAFCSSESKISYSTNYFVDYSCRSEDTHFDEVARFSSGMKLPVKISPL